MVVIAGDVESIVVVAVIDIPSKIITNNYWAKELSFLWDASR